MPRYRFGAVLFFALIHLGVVGAYWTPPTGRLLALALFTYAIRMFGVTAGYHRYFSHKSYKLGRTAQFAMAWLAQSSGQKGALWWAAHHREHHRESDRENDIHSPMQRGFWWAHVGWVLSNQYDDYDRRGVAEFSKYPELVWLDKHHWVPNVSMGAIMWITMGWAPFLWGYVISTVVLYHCTFSINSLAHLFGSRTYDTPDHSRNNVWLALVTFGEGWHNNHHYSPGSCRQGYRWWEVDITYACLKLLSWIGIARDLRPFREAQSKAAA